jgi:hypothetical protein
MDTTRHARVLDGIEAGRSDRQKCIAEADVRWFGKVAFDNLSGERDDYLRGYLHGLEGR